jgi:hypothetical protein
MLPNNEQTTGAKVSPQQFWSPLKERLINFNFDGVAKGNLVLPRARGVIRYWESKLSTCFYNIFSSSTNNHAEMGTLIKEIKLSLTMGLICLETKGLLELLIQFLNNKNKYPSWELDRKITWVKQAPRNLKKVVFLHVRPSNQFID